MKKEKLYLINYKTSYMKRGEIANVIGVKKISVDNRFNSETTNCFHIVFEDGHEDYIDMSTLYDEGWRFTTISELLRVGMP